jgi:hypothetical protein
VTSWLYQPFCAVPVTDDVMVGLVVSMLTVAGSEASLPALSVTVPVTAWFAPSVPTVWFGPQLATPEPPLSPQVKVTVTAPLFQPLTFAAGDCAWVIVGGVLSMLTVTVFAGSALPALSVLQYSTA